jgi:uncharacterized repeat protein (TIGR01451 family)
VTSFNSGSASDTAIVNVSASQIISNNTISIQKLGKDITAGTTVEQSSISTNPTHTLEFDIHINSSSNTSIYNVKVQDILPSGLSYIPNTTNVDGVIVSDGISGGGINIGTLSSYQQRIVKFNVLVAGSGSFSSGTTNLINTAQVSADNVSLLAAQLPISVIKGTAPIPSVPTGGGTVAFAALVSSMLAGGVLIYGRSYFAQKREVLKVIKRQSENPDKLNFV